MTLLDYLKTQTVSDRENLASKCATTVAQLNQVAYGNRKANVFLAVNLNRVTKKAVQLHSLRPDIDWHKLHKDLEIALSSQDVESLELEQAA